MLEGGLQYVDVVFDARVRAKGAVPLHIELKPFMGEVTADNNSASKSVRVVNEKINVLCIEGSARWEYRYLRAMLKRDPRINATFIAIKAKPEIAQNSSEYIARFPNKREDAFQYDLVILGDVDAKFFKSGLGRCPGRCIIIHFVAPRLENKQTADFTVTIRNVPVI